MVNSKVIVKVKGLQIVEETGDSVETVTPGKYYTRNNKHYVTYEDIDDETGVKTKNIIKFNDSFAEVKRSGFMSGKMIFEKYNKETLEQSRRKNPANVLYLNLLFEYHLIVLF